MKNKPYPLYDVPNITDLKDLLELSVTKMEGRDNDIAFMFPAKNKEVVKKTYQDFKYDVEALGTWFYSMGLKDCKIAVIGENSYDWINTYFSVVNGGNVVVPLDKELPAVDLSYHIINSGCKVLVYSKGYRDIAHDLREIEGMPIEYYICMTDLEEHRTEGRALIEAGNTEFCDYKIDPTALACIVYTSGTTGKSKGVMLTHKNLAADTISTCRNTTGYGMTTLVLPLHHTFGMVAGVFAPLVYKAIVYICKSMKTIMNEITTYKPNVIMLVPVIVETIYKKIWENVEKQGKLRKLQTGLIISNTLLRMGIDVRRKMFKQVLASFGGNLEMIICGGAALSVDVSHGLYSLGIDVINGYGITECAPVVSVNRNDYNRYGSVGLPVNCNEVKIDHPDADGIGEILVRGDNVMIGYYNDEEATKAAFTEDGWFRTGDVGRIDSDGFVFITGREKNLIILSNGKNISPEELEEKILKIPYIKEVVVYEEDKKITAEVFLDKEAEPNAEKRIDRDIDLLNRMLPPYKNIGKIKVRDVEFPKTTTLKIKRNYAKNSEVNTNA